MIDLDRIVQELRAVTDSAIATSVIKEHAETAFRQLRGSISGESLPEMVIRLAAVRLARADPAARSGKPDPEPPAPDCLAIPSRPRTRNSLMLHQRGTHMHAQVGDWLVVEGHKIDQMPRRAEIIAVPSADGGPPFTVRWLDSEHVAVVCPGPDARVITAASKMSTPPEDQPGSV